MIYKDSVTKQWEKFEVFNVFGHAFLHNVYT